MILIFKAMRKISFIALAVAAMAFASCQQEMAVPEAEGLFRVKGEAATRATVSDLGAFAWSSTDKIAVITDAGVKTLSYVKGDGIQATFDGDLSGVTSASAAVYPANVAVDANTVNLPSEYDYVEGEVYTPLYIANPSLTEVNEMKHLAGAVKIVIENVPANAAKFVLEANNKMTGEFAIDASGDTPVIKTEATEAAETVTVKFTPGANSSMSFYIPLPIGVYSSVKAQLLDAEGKVIDPSIKTAKNLSPARKSLVIMPGYTPSLSTFVEELYSSSAVVKFSQSAFTNYADDILRSYRVELYKDAEMENLVVSWGLTPNSNTQTDHFNKFTTGEAKQPRFVFTGLTPATKYYFVAKDVTDAENVIMSTPLEFTTKEFTQIDMSALAAGSAAAGDVILSEDFGEVVVGGFMGNSSKQAVGYVANGDFAKSEEALTPASGYIEMNSSDAVKYNYAADDKRYLMFGWGNNNLFGTLAPAVAKTRLKDWGQISYKKSDLTQSLTNTSGVLSCASALRLGTGSWYGLAVTPALAPLSGSATIKVTVTCHRAGSDPSILGIGLLTSATQGEENPHIFTDCVIKEVESYTLGNDMETYVVEIPNALPEHRVVFGVAPSSLKAGGASLRIIVKEVKVEVVEYGSTEVTIPTEIANANDLVTFLGNVDATTDVSSKIVADIDMKGVEFTPAIGFAGVLDGQGHSIKNLSGDKPLFQSNSGTIKNIILDASCAFTPGVEDFGPFVINNTGTLENLTNRGSITVTAEDATIRHFIGGIASASSGPITGCVNEGKITLTSAKGIASSLIGGIVGNLGATATDCVNKGEIKMEALYSNAPAAKAPYTQAVASTVSGIAAIAMQSGFKVVDCSNEAPLSYIENSLDLAEHTTASNRHGVSGICSFPYGEINGCVNNGKITSIVKSSDGAAYAGRENIVAVAGISGCDYVWHAKADAAAATNVIDCINNAEIYFYTDASKSNSTCGGIVSWPNPEQAGNKNYISGCVNNGVITVEGTGKLRAGGISAGLGAIRNSINNGKIIVKGSLSGSTIGGVLGFMSQNYELTGCSSLGDIDASSVTSSLAGVGGLVGGFGNVATSAIYDNKVNLELTTAASQTELGLVVGFFNGNTKAITIGSEEKPITVAGKVNGTTITATNFTSYLCGPANYTEGTHVINAVYGE